MSKMDRYIHGLFYLCVFSIPFQLGTYIWLPDLLLKGLRIDYLSIHLVVTDIALMALSLGLWLKGRVRLSLSLIVLIMWILLQSFWAVHPWLQGSFAVKVILWVELAISVKTLTVSEQIIARILMAQVFLLTILASLQWWFQHSLNGWWYWLGERNFGPTTPNIALEDWFGTLWLRPYATFSHPNVFAGYLVMTLWILVFLWQVRDRSVAVSEKMVWLTSLVCIGWLLVISYSQVAWFAVGIMGVLWMVSGWQRGLCLDLRLWIILCFTAPWFLLELNKYTILESLVLRNQLFQTWLETITLSKVFMGSGWMGTLAALGDLRNIVTTRALVQPLHHTWFLWLSALGAIGSVFWLKGLFELLEPVKSGKPLKILLVGILVLGSFDHYLFTQSQTWYVTALALGLTLRSSNKSS